MTSLVNPFTPPLLCCYNPHMDERAFVKRRQPEWERLMAILSRAASRQGIKSLSGEELRDLGKLYRRVTSDLSYVNANSTNEQLITYLNELAGRAHGILYAEAPTTGGRSAISFLLRGFPILFRAKGRFIAASAALMIISGVFAAVIVAHNPATAGHFMPADLSPGGDPQEQAPVHPQDEGINPVPATFSSFLMVNNIKVSLLAFAGGVTFGLLTVYILVYNGLVLGTFMVLPYPGLEDPLDLLAFVFPHGVIELTAICISGGAGLILGWALVAPGNLSRWDSLRRASRDALPLVAGVAVMLVIAALIESFVARSAVPRELKLLLAAASAVGLIAYFGLAGRGHTRHVR